MREKDLIFYRLKKKKKKQKAESREMAKYGIRNRLTDVGEDGNLYLAGHLNRKRREQ